MLITFVVILLIIGASVVGSIYSEFLTFYRNFEQTDNYNKAYYASLGALERAELAIRQRGPGYEGDGGWVNGVNTGSSYDPTQDVNHPQDPGEPAPEPGGAVAMNSKKLSRLLAGPNLGNNACQEMIGNNSSDRIQNGTGLSYLINGENSLYRSIQSLTKKIPAEGKGDIDQSISTGEDAKDYNKMDYENAEIFLLYHDNQSGDPYKTSAQCITKSNVGSIDGTIRLPSSIHGLLDTGNSLSTASNIKNDPIVDRQIRGNYSSTPFTIYSSSKTNTSTHTSTSQILNGDSVIREGDINSGSNNINFSNSKSPISRGNSYTNPERTIISAKDAEISGNAINFQDVLNGDSYTGLQLRMSLLNLLKGDNEAIYPYLEYQLNFGNKISDKYYTIDAEGKVGDYKVNLIVQKPTIRESVYGNFTVIF